MLIDQYGRTVNYLRVSVTERCNFRCLYCMPEKPFSWVPKENLLSYEELFSFIKVAIDGGITKIRITGGEPTLRENLEHFIGMIAGYKPGIDLALTTNGYLMAQHAESYKAHGLNRINISLDTLRPHVARKIAGKDVLEGVLNGIDASLEAGLTVKLNMVPMRGVNDGEILEILDFARTKGITVRFIEYMENSYANMQITGLSSDEILGIIRSRFPVAPTSHADSSSPARYYQAEDGFTFGIIEPHKEDFCKSCNRIRLSAEGDLIPCLYFDEAKSIKTHIRQGDIPGATAILKELLATKPEKNRWDPQGDISDRAFYMTGG